MIEGTSAYQLNADDLLERVDALLDEWGGYQRREPADKVGWPGATIEARMMEQWGQRSKRDQSKRNPAWARRKRMVEVGQGNDTRKVPARPMAPERVDKGTDVRRSANSERWPEHIQAVERILAGMPAELLSVVCRYYVNQFSQRETADLLRTTQSEIRNKLQAARWWVASRIPDDPALNG